MQKKATPILYKTLILMILLHGVLLGLGYEIKMPSSLTHQFSLMMSQMPSITKTDTAKTKTQLKPRPMAKNTASSTLEPYPVTHEPPVDVPALSAVDAEVGVQSIKQKYFNEISHEIHKHKYYPRRAYSLNQEGVILVSLKLGKNGNILNLFLVEECPFESLNHAALDTISSIGKFPPIPDELGINELTLKIPVEYKIKM